MTAGLRWLGSYINTPGSELNRIGSEYGSDRECKEALIHSFLSSHPAPSWLLVAWGLYLTAYITGDSSCQESLDHLQQLYPTGRYRNKRQHDLEMKHGYILIDLDKLLVGGIAGSGKSTFLDSLLGQNPSYTRCSTPLLKEPIKIKIIDKKGKKEWIVESLSELKSKIAEILQSRITQRQTQTGSSVSPVSTHNLKTTVVQSAQPTPEKTSSSTSESAEQLTTHLEKSEVVVQQQETGVSLDSVWTEVDDELVSLMGSAPSSSEGPILRQRLFLALDSGGQPELLEMMPVFLKGASKYAYIFKLNESLDERGKIAFYRKGELVSEYPSSLTNEAILRLFLRTIVSFNNKNPNIPPAKLMLVGTHRDLVPREKLPGVLDTLHKKLKEILLPQFRDQLIFRDPATEEFVFPLNAKEPDDEDLKCAESIREGLGEVGDGGKEVEVPLRWYAMYYKLLEAGNQLGKKVLPRDLCQKVAASLEMNEESCEAALEFFHGLNMLFYFRKILPQIVFIVPQMLLNKVSELVDETYELRKGGKERPIAGERLKFRDYAQVTEKYLSEFEKHFEPPLFMAKELVILLKHLLVFAEMSEGVYFVPCLLKVVGWEEVENHRVSGDKALAIHFPDSGPLLGMFCSTVAYLMSTENQHPCPWKAVEDDSGAPKCLHRNVIKFSIPKYKGTITLIDHFTHYELHLHTLPKKAPQLWKLAHEAVFAGLKKAKKTIGYTKDTPEVAIVCPAHHTTSIKPHPATVDEEGGWGCSMDDDEFGEVEPNTIPWLSICSTLSAESSEEDSNSSSICHPPPPTSHSLSTTNTPLASKHSPHSLHPSSSSSSSSSSQLCAVFSGENSPSLPDLLRLGIPQSVGVHYNDFGVLLLNDTTGNVVESIKEECHWIHDRICQRILREWLRGKGLLPVTWQTLVRTLKDTGLHDLAEKIRTQLS